MWLSFFMGKYMEKQGRRRAVDRKSEAEKERDVTGVIGESAFCAGSPVCVYRIFNRDAFCYDRYAGVCYGHFCNGKKCHADRL